MKKVCLIIMDGWGLSARRDGNATMLSMIPNLAGIYKDNPMTALVASGESVGLPDGQMGNSEVGHLTIGAGRVVYQELTKINKAIKDNALPENPVIKRLISSVLAKKGALHVMGLVSDGGVHSHIDHLYALLDVFRSGGVKVYVHAFLDGRDTPPKSGLDYITALNGRLEKTGGAEIATVSGRFYAMDRDKRWDRVKKAYDAMTLGAGVKAASAITAVKEAYRRGETDEFVMPTVIAKGFKPMTAVDSALFFNFRADRAREMVSALGVAGFDGFDTKGYTIPVVCMTEYDARFGLPVIFSQTRLENILGEVLGSRGIRQFRVSETEKYAHVTFFFNNGREEPFPGEDRLLIPSVKDVATYDKRPEMRAREIAEAAVEKINQGGYAFMLMNFANGDMVGHTGILDAAVRACEAVDSSVGKVVSAAIKKDWSVIITSDHGNCEQMVDYETKGPHTAHTTNPVPLVIVNGPPQGAALRSNGGLKDIAPTVLKLMSIEKPVDMDGEPLF